MNNRENLKIILSALLVILIISFGVYVFIFRNELTNKINEISKVVGEDKDLQKLSADKEQKVERLVLEKDKPSPNLEDFEKLAKSAKEAEKKKIEPLPLEDKAASPNESTAKNQLNKEKFVDRYKDQQRNDLNDSDAGEKSQKNEFNDQKRPKKSIKPKTKHSKVHTQKKKRKHKKSSKKNTKSALEKRVIRMEKKIGLSNKKNMTLEKRIKRLENKVNALEEN